MADFCTVAQVATFLQIEIVGAAHVSAAEQACSAVTAAVKNYCRQNIELVEDDVVTFDRPRTGSMILLPELPVVSIASVVEDGETLTADDDYKLGEDGTLYRMSNGSEVSWATGVQVVTVTYTHGYAEGSIPDDIVEDVCIPAAARRYQAGLKSEALGGMPSVTGFTLGDYTVQYGSEGTEGSLGASAARALLLSEKDILDKYRLTV